MVYVGGVIMWGGSINTKKKTKETLIFAGKEKELEIKSEKEIKKQDKMKI